MAQDCGCDCSKATCLPNVTMSASDSKETGACMLVPGKCRRRVSVTVDVTNAAAGLRVDPVAGTHKSTQLLVGSPVTMQDDGDTCGVAEWTLTGVRLAVEIDEAEVRGYVNQKLLETRPRDDADSLNAYLVFTGAGQATFRCICVEPL